MFEITILAIALSMDAFAVSLTMGVSNPKRIQKLALLAGLYFGLFQGLIPLFGYLGDVALFGWIGDFAHWIAFLLLVIIGLKMIFEAVTSQREKVQHLKHILTIHYYCLQLPLA